MLRHLFSGENFQESDQLQAVGEVRLQVVDGGLGLAELLIDPPGEGLPVLLHPLLIIGMIPLSISHGFFLPVLLLSGFSSWKHGLKSGRGRKKDVMILSVKIHIFFTFDSLEDR